MFQLFIHGFFSIFFLVFLLRYSSLLAFVFLMTSLISVIFISVSKEVKQLYIFLFACLLGDLSIFFIKIYDLILFVIGFQIILIQFLTNQKNKQLRKNTVKKIIYIFIPLLISMILTTLTTDIYEQYGFLDFIRFPLIIISFVIGYQSVNKINNKTIINITTLFI